MNITDGIIYLAGICGVVLAIFFLKKRAHLVLNFLVRLVLGAILILCINEGLEKQGIDLLVGLNPISLLTSGSLGISGVALLYAVEAIKFL